jgi:hypothetical protein
LTAVMAGNSCCGWLGSVPIVEVLIWDLPQNGGNVISDLESLDFKFSPQTPSNSV